MRATCLESARRDVARVAWSVRGRYAAAMTAEPDSTAIRSALWRAMHVQVDAPPHVFTDVIGLELAAPDASWRERQDMHPQYTRGMRAAMVARARFVEDLLAERGASQYVILGAGLDTFAQRRPEIASRMQIFEIDRGGPQRWKQRRLVECGYGMPDWLHFVPVDFEAGESWLDELAAAGFDRSKPAFVASTGVAMYLTRDAIDDTLRKVAMLAPGSTLVMTFIIPIELMLPEDRPAFEWAKKGAEASGTPFATMIEPAEMLARAAAFKSAQHVAGTTIAERYFAGRPDHLRPSSGEDFLVAST